MIRRSGIVKRLTYHRLFIDRVEAVDVYAQFHFRRFFCKIDNRKFTTLSKTLGVFDWHTKPNSVSARFRCVQSKSAKSENGFALLVARINAQVRTRPFAA